MLVGCNECVCSALWKTFAYQPDIVSQWFKVVYLVYGYLGINLVILNNVYHQLTEKEGFWSHKKCKNMPLENLRVMSALVPIVHCSLRSELTEVSPPTPVVVWSPNMLIS